MSKETEMLIVELKKLLSGGAAHVGVKEAIADIPFELLGEQPHNIPYSIWQLTEHIRITQLDMLEFSRNAAHQSPEWPEGYWPQDPTPKDKETWEKTVEEIENDLDTFIELLESEDLYETIPHGTGQSILREALQIADHTAYHIAQIIIIRRLLGIWKS